MSIAGLILAGGLSRRLGQPKQLLPFGDGTLLEHAIAQAEAVREIDPLVVVLPPGESVPEPRQVRAQIVRREASDGCSASLRTGLQLIGEGADAVVILPADQPKLTSGLISLAIRAWQETSPPALTLSFNGQPGHPLVFSRALLGCLKTLHGEKGLWHLLEELGDAVERVEVHQGPLEDVDTWADYQRLVAKQARVNGVRT